MRTAKHALIWIILFALLVPILEPLTHLDDPPIKRAVWVLTVLSAISNVMVLLYYFTTPAHPKFSLLPKRRFALSVHISSGSIELVAGCFAIFGHSRIAAIVMALAALCGHVPSAAFQTPIVFGAKMVMWPAYALCVGLHGFCAAELLLHPASTFWAINTFLVLNVYVWVRVLYFVFDWAELFKGSLYSVSILSAGLVVAPAIMGPAGSLAVFGFVGAYIGLYLLFFRPSLSEFRGLVRERPVTTLVHREIQEIFREADGSVTPLSDKADRENARRFFDRLDRDGSGYLADEEITPILADWDVPGELVAAFVRAHTDEGRFDFERFYTRIWRIGHLRDKARNPPRANTDRERAQAVFDELDLDRSGHIDPFELQILLVEWGLPPADAEACLGRLRGKGGDPKAPIEFDEFLRKMHAIWEFGYHQILRVDREQETSNAVTRSIESAVYRLKAPLKVRDTRSFDVVDYRG